MNRTIYKTVVVGLFLTMMGVVMGLVSPELADTDLGVVGSQVHLPVIVSTFVLYAFVLSRLIFQPARFRRALPFILYTLPLCIFCLASSLWSTNEGLTIRRVLILFLTILVAWIVGTDFRLREIGRMLATASAIHMLLCVALYFTARHYVYSPSDPLSLKGLTTHKNVFGFEQGLAVLTFLFIPLGRYRVLSIPLAAVSFGMLLMSRSTGSLIATLVALAAWPFMQAVRFRRRDRLPVLAVTAMLAVGLLTALGSVSDKLPALFSKNSTLTGRTELWQLITIAIEHRFWLGYGFDSFWQGLQGDSLTVIRSVGWLVPTAHNGYLDLLLGIGAVGALLFSPVLLQGIVTAVRVLDTPEGKERFFPGIVIVYWLVYNLNESALLTRSGQPLFLIIAVTVSLKVHKDIPSFSPMRKPVAFDGAPYVRPLPA